jgi:hypothetical protein
MTLEKHKMKKTQYEQLVALVRSTDTDACVEFRLPKDKINGYPRVRMPGKNVLAHRISYSLSNNVPLSEMDERVVRHACDNPPCVNPRHLEIGSQKDNVDDMVARGRKVNPHPGHGENHHHAKLTLAQIEEARRLYVRGGRNNEFSYNGLAKRYGVGRKAISNALQGKSWTARPVDLVKSDS